MQNNIILVDTNDNPIGTCEKMDAHTSGKLHRAFSIFIFNSKNQLLIQKRAKHKYHSGGLWANTCCSHPRMGKNLHEEANERLMEEMGIQCDIEKIFSFIYKAEFDDNGLFEHELDHVFIGKCDQQPSINLNEVEDYKWINTDDLLNDIKSNPQDYAYWFRFIISRVLKYTSAITV